MSFRISDVQRALNSIVKASKPREKIVSHILKRAWVRCACDPSSNVPILLPLVKAFSKKRNDFYSKDSPMILHAGNIVRLFELWERAYCYIVCHSFLKIYLRYLIRVAHIENLKWSICKHFLYFNIFNHTLTVWLQNLCTQITSRIHDFQ